MSHPGLDSRLQLRIVAGLPAKHFGLAEGENFAGRSPELSSITLEHPGLPPTAAKITCRGLRCSVEPLDTGISVFLNGAPVSRASEFRPGDILHVGPVCLQFIDADSPESAFAPLVVKGRVSSRIDLLPGSMTLGSDSGCDVILAHQEISSTHARLLTNAAGTEIAAVNDDGDCRINGQYFDKLRLTYGDQVDLGPFHFQFDGRCLQLISGSLGAAVVGDGLSLRIKGHLLLNRAALTVEPSEFAGIVGPTGAGKSTLLATMNGLNRPDSGRVSINGLDLYANLEQLSREFGWVPQEDIVHRDLTVRQALTFAAQFRLPRETPSREMAKLVDRTIARLGLERRSDVQVKKLSGGEIKKVSVGVELLCRPQVLFLDEPTSGLDPGAEANMMQLLRQLANSGCTVICTTHTMQSVYLLDKLIVMREGSVLFRGAPEEAQEFFGVRDMSAVFPRMLEQPVEVWNAAFESYKPSTPAPEATPRGGTQALRPKRRALQLPLLIGRQAAVFFSDWRNLLILLAQPVLIGALLSWAVVGTADDTALKLFFAAFATLWLGCSNGAQEIIGEIAIYRRERMVGLHRNSYVLSKWLFVGFITLLQSAMLYGITALTGEGLDGSAQWQMMGLGVMALLAASFGLAISAISGSPMQAVLLVPLFIIPQIVLSGYTVPSSVMEPAVHALSEFVPSFQMQRIMDTSLLWGRTIDASTLEHHLQAFQNLNQNQQWKIGDVFFDTRYLTFALIVEGVWFLCAYAFTLLALRRKELQRRT